MSCLPIAGRELRVAARKRSTFWLRVMAAVTGLVISGGCLILGNVARAGTAQMGRILFAILSWLGLFAGLSAGLFLTSDALSEEKRDGTLGLLFLTDLRGYDVAAGKLMATSLRAFYALLAVLPILALTLLMGGITGAQYWKSSLALVNALFISLAAGMLISALSRDSQKAMAATLLVLLVLSIAGPMADGIAAGVRKQTFAPLWSLSSPCYLLQIAGAWGRSAYWDTLLISQLLAWGMFAATCIVVPYTWQERKRAGAGIAGGLAYAWKYGGRKRREKRSRTIMESDPMAWLAGRERWQSLGLWGIALLVVGSLAFILFKHPKMESWILWNYTGGFFTLLLYLCAASLACRFLVEARRSGLLELLLVSPLDERQIVRGQWRALLRMFGLPVLLLVGVYVTGATLAQLSMLRLTTQAGSAISTATTNQARVSTNQTGRVTTTFTFSAGAPTNAISSTFPRMKTGAQKIALVVAPAAAALRTAANVWALVWCGLWMGLTSKSANLATLKTILFVQVIPWFIIAFATSMLIGILLTSLFRGFSGPPGWWFAWWPLISAVAGTVLATAKDVGFVLWSRKRLHTSFREQASRNPGQAPPVLMPACSSD